MVRTMRQWVQALPIVSCLAGSCATTRHTAMSIYLEARSISTLPKSKRGSWFGADATTDYKSLEPLCLYAWDMHGQTPKIVQFILAICSMRILSWSLFKPLVLCIQVLLLHSNDGLWDCRTPCFVLYHITWFTSEHARLWSLDPQFCAIFRTSYPLICATNTLLQRPTANQLRLSFQTPKIVQSLQYSNPSNCANECCGSLSALRTP